MSTQITQLQKRIFAFITDAIRGDGYPPTIREIGRRFRIAAPSSVAYHLKVLAEKGLIKRMGAISRGLSLASHPLRLPILGRVGAGEGMIAQEDIEGYVDPDKDLLRGAHFLLRVRGDSMDAAGILEGDLVQVRRQDAAEDGDIVVALVQDEGVVKRLARRGRDRRLESANPAYPPIAKDFKIVGKVVGLIRRYDR
ncbi:MAG: transcriptional repressor LexA [Elusimicrobiota bacterium]